MTNRWHSEEKQGRELHLVVETELCNSMQDHEMMQREGAKIVLKK